mmetsp:Transcript_27926/g.84193  ORF Transcript_27926/g.84193 Transcript_27926/m.84193 type:complete len:208 (-) Transcript_27926:277-900(-)
MAFSISLTGTPSRKTTSKRMPSVTPPGGMASTRPTQGGTYSPSSAASSSPTTKSIGAFDLSSRITRPSVVFAKPMRVSLMNAFMSSFAMRKWAVTLLRSATAGPLGFPSRRTCNKRRPSPSRSTNSPTSNNSISMLSVGAMSLAASAHSSSGRPRICMACLRRADVRMSSGTSLNSSRRAPASGSHCSMQRSTVPSTLGHKACRATS